MMTYFSEYYSLQNQISPTFWVGDFHNHSY